MSDSLFSSSWYRVAGLRPRIRVHVRINRHSFRGEVWFVLQDAASERSHRFSAQAYHVIGLMNGERTVQQIWESSCSQLGDEAPSQDDVIRMLGQLHAADALLSDVPPDTMEIFRRLQKHERMKWRRRLWSPLALRFPLIDPDRFLRRTQHWVDPLFGAFGIVLWTAVVGAAAVLAALHWTDLTQNITDRVLAPQNLLALWLLYPLVKALHELGHAYATRHWGGEVHEIGVMLLVLAPVPYVDASAASAFKDKRHRMVVGAIGIGVELFLGAVALFIWLSAESGLVRALAFNVILITGLSTLLFNGNPLLRFDGYYVLADWLEIPNLGHRANQYLGYLLKRYLFGVKDAKSSAHTSGERIWMAVYGVAAFTYRVFITFAIVLFISSQFFFVGVVLALWAVATQVIVPMGKSMSFLFSSPDLGRQRGRALWTSLMLVMALAALLVAVPAPSWTRAEGVVWLPEEAQVRAGSDGLIVEFLAAPDSVVQRGQPLLRAEEPFLAARVEVLRAQRDELRTRYEALITVDRAQAASVREQWVAAEANWKRAQERAEDMVFRSPVNGRFIVASPEDLPGRFVKKGQLVGYVVASTQMTARVVVPQDDIAMVRQSTQAVEVMLGFWGSSPIQGTIRRELPGASQKLPTAALGSAAGGPIPVDPRDGQGLTALRQTFQLELALPAEVRSDYIGARLHVRFDHGFEPMGFQIYRAARRLFLRHFSI
jgi:putative peptide zinc metalloprotease protein